MIQVASRMGGLAAALFFMITAPSSAQLGGSAVAAAEEFQELHTPCCGSPNSILGSGSGSRCVGDLYLLQTDMQVNRARQPLQTGAASGVDKLVATVEAQAAERRSPTDRAHHHVSHRLAAARIAARARAIEARLALAHAASALNSRQVPSGQVGSVTMTTTVGIAFHGEGALSATFAGLVINVLVLMGCVAAFVVGCRLFPKLFFYNVEEGIAPDTIPSGHLGWMWASINLRIEKVATSPIGLDEAMLLEFCHFCMRVLLIIGAPLMLILGPMNWLFGGNAAGRDLLSSFSMDNVQPSNWLYWFHAVVIWGVIVAVVHEIFRAQDNFLKVRQSWLMNLPAPRSTTLLVEGIPMQWRTDSSLKEFFSGLFGPDKVKEAYVVKQTGELMAAVAEVEKFKRELNRARHAQATGKPLTIEGTPGVEYYKKKVAEAKPEIERLKKEVQERSVKPEANAECGFVTFHHRTDAEIAAALQYGVDTHEWAMSAPPAPGSVLWTDLMQEDHERVGFTILGYLLMAGIYLAYVPLVIGITTIAISIDLGPLQSVWAGLAPTAGLQIVLAFLPMFFANIFHWCFTRRDGAWAQRMLQDWYFAFLVFFVLLVTAIGSSVGDFTKTLLNQPLDIFAVLNEAMPDATHFYMRFLMVQWAAHGINLTRYQQVAKYIMNRRVYDADLARVLAEPEDQDYHGIGSRSARFTTNLCIGIIFSTLSPPIAILAFINFAVSRVIYGYLICFAETQKPDLGGAFWVGQLQHLFVGVMIYSCMMIGVLFGRAGSVGPAVIVAPSLIYIVYSMQRFRTAFAWEKMPYPELAKISGTSDKKGDNKRYIQPELLYRC